MKKIIQNITKRNIWLVNFTSCLAGTILGIALTFGISSYIQEQERKELFYKTVEFSLANIDRNLSLIEEEVEISTELHSLFQSLYKHYPLGANDVNTDSLYMCFNAFLNRGCTVIDNSAKSIFSNNIETWKNSDNLELLEDIGDCFSIIDRFNYEKVRIEKIQDDFNTQFLNIGTLSELIDNPEKLAETYFKTPGFQNYLIQFGIYMDFIGETSRVLNRFAYIADSTYCVEVGLDPAVDSYLDSEYFDDEFSE